MKITFSLPIKTVSEMNMREHWAAKHIRLKNQKEHARWVTWHQALKNDFPKIKKGDLVMIDLCRNGKKKLDADNLASSFKGVIDGVCAGLLIDDANVDMRFSQTIGNKDYSVDVTIEVIK